MTKDNLWKLTGCVQHYPWGGKKFIPELTCLANDEEKPFAELWYGQHPGCPSRTSDGIALSDLMASSPERVLTSRERKHWKDELPFLCKILDVRDMLSIQIHPTKTQALEGWEHEEESMVDPSAPHRTFRDRNHKPEIMYALSDFYLLHDFREDDEIIDVLQKIKPLAEIAREIQSEGLPRFYRTFMQQSQRKINQALQPFVHYIEECEIPEDPMKPEYWVKRALDQYCTAQKIDRGILSFYLMNLVHLNPGEVVFQDSGIPHAYLRGQNVEIMANSDNVIRGGLTFKHIDSDALSRLVRFDERSVHYLQPRQVDQTRTLFAPPVGEFQLSVIKLEPGQEYPLHTSHVSILFSTCNCFKVRSDHQEIRVSGGEAILARAGESLVLQTHKAADVFFVTPQR